MNGYPNMMSPLRWLETVTLRAVYSLIRGLVAVRNGFNALRRRALLFTGVMIGCGVLVVGAAIPVSHYLLGDDLAVSAAEKASSKGTISGKGGDSPFAALGSLNSDSGEGAQETAVEHAAKHADPTYICPMHPEIISKDASDTCPICGMDLVLVDASGDGGVVSITPETQQALGVRTDTVSRRTIFRSIDTVGYIAEDENNIRTVSLRTDGWVEHLAVKTVGEYVKKGQLLLELYSPVLVNAQEEYLQALSMGNQMLVSASEERLRSLGVSDKQIKDVAAKGKPDQLVAIYAPQNGYVAELHVREGMQMMPSKPIVRLVDLDSVWLMVDVFERQAEWVQEGARARATLPFMPDKSWKGTVEYVYPSIDPKTRSLKVRLKFDNPDMALKPNMYADVRILAKPKKDALTIPREAVIRTGGETRVIVAMGDGKFMPMPVAVGIETDDLTEVTSGLQEGDEVVVSSQFMIDSEASVKAALMKMMQ